MQKEIYNSLYMYHVTKQWENVCGSSAERCELDDDKAYHFAHVCTQIYIQHSAIIADHVNK